jgi:Fe-S cluster assembly protein SufD
MAIESFLKVDERDPDWTYSPNHYFGKQFKVIDANCLMIKEGTDDSVVLRLNPTESDLLCKHLQIIGKESSNLNLFILCEGDSTTQQVFLYHIEAQPDSNLNIGVFIKNGKLNKHIFECSAGENSSISIFGIAENTEGGSSEIISKIHHEGPNVETNQIVNCVSGKESRTVFQGHVRIVEDMINSYTQINNASIITDESGQAFSIPQLAIDCGKVEANHSCSIGEFDEEQLWYLRTRGIEVQRAKEILLESHRGLILNLIEFEDLKDEVKEFFNS